MEKRKELVRQDDVDALIDQIAGTVLTAMSARCAPRGDLATRRAIGQVVLPTTASRRATNTASLDEQD